MRQITHFIPFVLFVIFCNSSCSSPGSAFEPRNVDWRKEWTKTSPKLKALAKDIAENPGVKYSHGINDFPTGFKYPFDDGFALLYNKEYPEDLTIIFYIDRGLLDHYSAFIYTTDTLAIHDYDFNVANGGNDFKLEPNWYIIND